MRGASICRKGYVLFSPGSDRKSISLLDKNMFSFRPGGLSNAGFSLWFYLPRCHVGFHFLTHSQGQPTRGKFISPHDLRRLAAMAPGSTLKVMKQGSLEREFRLQAGQLAWG